MFSTQRKFHEIPHARSSRIAVSENQPRVHTTWGEILSRQESEIRALIARELEDFSNIAARAVPTLPSAFSGVDNVLARGILVCGTAAVRPLISLMSPSLRNALPAVTDHELHHTQSARWILSFALVAECAGITRPAGFDEGPLKPLVSGRDGLSDPERRCAAFLALALGDAATARALIGAAAKTWTQPVLRFEFNLYELIRYLADAIDQRRPADWIEPVWLEYFAGFPMHLAADAARWPDIFCFARILANVRGERIGQIADDLHARVRLLAQQGQ
jgi:hypothetical protein